MSELSSLRKAIEIAGGQAKLAAAIGLKQQTISWWLNNSGRASAEYVLKIAEVTGVSPHELRPDIYPASLRAGAA